MTAIPVPTPGAARMLHPGAGAILRVLRPLAATTGRWATRALVAVAVLAFAVLAAGPHLFGYRTMTMLTASMAPGIDPGDVVITTPLAVTDVTEGMVISYHIPIDDHRVVTHRVIDVQHSTDGAVTVQTKGDANDHPDPWTAVLQGDTAYQVQAVVPELGHLITALRTPAVNHALIYGVPAVLAVWLLLTIWRPQEDAGSDERDTAVDGPVATDRRADHVTSAPQTAWARPAAGARRRSPPGRLAPAHHLPAGRRGGQAVSAVPTALVVGPDAAGRALVAGLLRVTGWDVREAAGTREALASARRLDLDLVVTDLDAPAGEAPALLRRLRLVGCRAHLLAVTAEAGAQDRAAVLEAGALACLPEPVDAGLLLGLLDRRAVGPQTPGAGDLPGDDVDAELMDRLQGVYAAALPDRLTAIADGARTGDAAALARASATLAGTSAQLGHPEVAAICRAIAQDARRGVLAHELVVELAAVTGS